MQGCIFCRIVRGEIPATRVYEDEDILVFPDIHPQAPVHLLVIPKAHVATLYDATPAHEKAFGRMLSMAGELARRHGAADGFRTIINTGKVGHQEVYHVHMHILGGPHPLGRMLSRKAEGG
ncbi:MAG: histidine triad nucleotide-binding protein [Burkholderiales bacterium]